MCAGPLSRLAALGGEVALGGGRAYFLPAEAADPEDKEKTGRRTDKRDLTAEWTKKDNQHLYVFDKAGFDAADLSSGAKLLGLFEMSHMEYEADRAKDRFLAMLSHEMRTPLTVLTGGVNLLLAADPEQLGSDDYRALLDEVGRGTSTFDGLAIAWAVVEDLHDRARAKVLFATHFHELTRLAERRSGIRNFHVAVREWNDEIVFLHKVQAGGTDRSYGIQVARLAGLPTGVVARAKALLARFEEQGQATTDAGDAVQLGLFAAAADPLAGELAALDLAHLTPIEALNLLAKWQQTSQIRIAAAKPPR